MSQNRATAVWKEIKPFAIRDIGSMMEQAKSSNQADGYFIILYDADGQVKREYSFSEVGLRAALAAAASGDAVWVPPGMITLTGGGFSVGSEISSGAIPVTSAAGSEISGLTVGYMYAVEATGGPWYAWPDEGGPPLYAYHLSNDGGSTWSVWIDVSNEEFPSWADGRETVDTNYVRVYFQATTTSIKIQVGDAPGQFYNNSGSLGWKLSNANFYDPITIPSGVELVGFGKNTVIDGAVINSGKITNLTVTGEISDTGEYLCFESSGLLVTNKQIKSALATGTAPLVVASTTAVSNLNSDLLDGQHAEEFVAASDLTNHTGNTSNPHSVTATQVGLGSIASDLNDHVTDYDNPHQVTAAQILTRWEVLTNGDPVMPELIFDEEGDVLLVEVMN